MFADRADAGKKLALALTSYKNNKQALVIGLPRGGVAVAFEIAKALHLPLDVIAVAKLGAPYNPELAVGAIAADEIFLNQPLIEKLAIPEQYLREEIERKKMDILRKLSIFRGKEEESYFRGRIVILVDDGMATGSTMEVAVHAMKRKKPQKIVIAIPVALPEVVKKFQRVVEEIVCLSTPDEMAAVGQFYRCFKQVSDQEVVQFLKKANAPSHHGLM